jgi:predicted CopG family antitoxin
MKGIKVEEDVYDSLTKLGSKNETFSDIVKKTVEYYKKGYGFLTSKK